MRDDPTSTIFIGVSECIINVNTPSVIRRVPLKYVRNSFLTNFDCTCSNHMVVSEASSTNHAISATRLNAMLIFMLSQLIIIMDRGFLA